MLHVSKIIFKFLFIHFYFHLFFLFFFSDVISEESIKRALFVSLKDENEWRNKKFGDVITLSNGKLEFIDGTHFRITELYPNCRLHCMEATLDGNNVTAFWMIQKIRHRDEQRGYRYEIKITVNKMKNNRFDGKRAIDQNFSNSRSFLIRDQDFPEYFSETATDQKSMDKRMFNTAYDRAEFPFYLDYRTKFTPTYPSAATYDLGNNLNTGEYYTNRSPPLVIQTKPSNDVQNQQNQDYIQAVNSHPIGKFDDVHHHYFLNKNEVPIYKTSNYEKVTSYPVNSFNSIPFTNNLQHTIRNEVSIPRSQHLNTIATSSQAPFDFSNPITVPITQNAATGYRGPYDDNRESILEGEIDRNNINDNNNQNLNFAFPTNRPTTSVTRATSISIAPTVHTFETNASPATSLLQNPNFVYANQLQSNAQYQQANQFYWYGYGNPQYKQNFVPSHQYQENTYSELDPVYHNPAILVTPINVLPIHLQQSNGDTTDTNPRSVTQIPIHSVDVDSHSYKTPTENYQTSSVYSESGYTTPITYATTTQSERPDFKNEQHFYPDSINAQLPPPDSGIDLNVPYVETDKGLTSIIFNQERKDENFSTENPEYVSSDKYEVVKTEKSPKKSTRVKNELKTTKATTEIPSSTSEKSTKKYSRVRGPSKYNSNDRKQNRNVVTVRRRRLKTTTTTEPIITSTFDNNDFTEISETTTIYPEIDTIDDNEPRTSQSIQKSISVHVGDKVTVIPSVSTNTPPRSKYNRKRFSARKSTKATELENTTENSKEAL